MFRIARCQSGRVLTLCGVFPCADMGIASGAGRWDVPPGAGAGPSGQRIPSACLPVGRDKRMIPSPPTGDLKVAATGGPVGGLSLGLGDGLRLVAAQGADAGAQEGGDGLLDSLHRLAHLPEVAAHHLAAFLPEGQPARLAVRHGL